jgi:DNA-binding transcriptional LysR family regulator
MTANDLNLLASMQLLLETRNVTQAARRAGVTQSAMSRTLGRLREVFGDPLFVRTRAGIEPTSVALGLEQPVREALAAASQVFAGRTPFDPATASRTFVIAATDVAALVLLPGLLQTIGKVAPGIKLVVTTAERFADALEADSIDLAISFGAPSRSELRWQVLLEDELVCVAREGHPAFARKLTLRRYLDCEHLVITPAPTQPDAIERALRKRAGERRVVMRTSHFLVAPPLLRDRELVLTTGARVARELSRITRLVTVPAPVDIGPVRIGQIWHERDDRDPAHAWLRAQLRAVGQGDAVTRT